MVHLVPICAFLFGHSTFCSGLLGIHTMLQRLKGTGRKYLISLLSSQYVLQGAGAGMAECRLNACQLAALLDREGPHLATLQRVRQTNPGVSHVAAIVVLSF